jgi:hypothetical protein
MQRGLARAVCCIDVAAPVQQESDDRHAIIQGCPLQRKEALLVGAVQRLWLRVGKFPQLLKVAIGRRLPHCAHRDEGTGQGGLCRGPSAQR